MADAARAVKRFWEHVTVLDEGNGFGIALDARPVRTPGRTALAVPTRTLAEAIADEWRAVGGDIDPAAMPLTGLANAAIDRIAPDPAVFAAGLATYGESDLLCYRADGPESLVDRQRAAWEPLLAWASGRYDVRFATTAGIVHVAQPPETIARLHDTIAARTPFELAPLSIVVTITGSLVAALALVEAAADAATIWTAATVDEDWQAEKWGEDDLAIKTRAAHLREYDAAVRFLAALADEF